MRLGLAANRLHHHNEDAALFRWLRACEPGIRELGLELHAVGRTHDAIAAAGMLAGHAGLKRYPYGREGGLMKLVADAETRAILGAAILGPGGDEAIHGVVDMMNAGATIDQLAWSVPIHPTVSELIPTLVNEAKPA